jgi:hypothetical protein
MIKLAGYDWNAESLEEIELLLRAAKNQDSYGDAANCILCKDSLYKMTPPRYLRKYCRLCILPGTKENRCAKYIRDLNDPTLTIYESHLIHKQIDQVLKEIERKKTMTNLKVVRLDSDTVEFENGIKLYSNHDQECCESHFLDFSDLTMNVFNGLEFDLSNSKFFKRIEGYGIELIPINGRSVKVPGYGTNNGFYSSQLDLILTNEKDFKEEYNISECQEWKDY